MDCENDPLVNVYREYEPRPEDTRKTKILPRSWPKHKYSETKAVAEVMPLSEALTRGFRYPAYLTAHAPLEGNRRLSKDILSSEKPLAHVGGSVPMQLFLVDVDGPAHNRAPGHQGDSEEPSEESDVDGGDAVEPAGHTQETAGPESPSMDLWWEEQLPKIEKLLADHPGLFIYRSRGGYRIVGRLPRPFNLSSLKGAIQWTQNYVSWVNYLNRKYQIRTYGKDTADKLAEWNRLQRVPHDSRDFLTPDQLETIGNPKKVGIWDPKILPEDKPPEPKRALAKLEQDNSKGALLLELVLARGLRCSLSTPNEYDICCPRYMSHSPNESGERDYEGKTRLYTAQGKLGGIKCFSDGCTASHPTPGDWMDEFSWQEKLAARRTLGLSTLGEPRKIEYESLKLLEVNYNAISILQDGLDESKPDKTVQQCIHQVVCELLRKSVLPECILFLLTDQGNELSEHVLGQIDPGWYMEEAMAKARDAIATPQQVIDIEHADAVVVDLIKTTSENFRNIYGFLSRDRQTAFSDDDVDLGKMAVQCFGRVRCRYIEGQGSWVIHNGHRWVPGEDGRIRTLLVELARCLEAEAKNVSSGLSGASRNALIKAHMGRVFGIDPTNPDELKKSLDKELEKLRGMAKKLKQKAGLNAVLTMVGDALTITVDDLDNNPDQVIFLNGTWYAVTNTFTAVSPEDPGFPTRACDIEWRIPTDQARQRWQSYLSSLGFDDATLLFLQRSFGYALLGRGGEKRFWWFRGETGTGKTTIVELIAQCLGTYVVPTPTDLWLAKGGSRPGHTDDQAALRGCRLVTADEFPKVSRFDDALMKKCTSGGSPLRVSEKGKRGFAFVPRFAQFFTSNFDPQIAEDDEALMTRLTALTFKNRVPEGAKNPKFVSDFLKQDGQKVAILEWIMQGARDYLASGLVQEPVQVKQSRVDFAAGQISVEDQLAELLRKEDGARVSVTMVMSRLADLQHRTRQRCQYTPSQVRMIICRRFGAKADNNNGVRSFIGVALRQDSFAQRTDPSSEPDPDYTPEPHEGFQAPGF